MTNSVRPMYKVAEKTAYKTALITGASSGLGRGLALAFGKKGTHVIAAARRKTELDSLVAEIISTGGSAEVMVLDCSSADAAYETVRALDQRKPLDLVIANAGTGFPTPAQAIEWIGVKQILELNLLGAVATLSGALTGMVERNSGQLVAMASLAGYHGLPGGAAYCASKAALISFCESLRIDLHHSGVGVTTICPGYVETDLTAKNKGKLPFLMKLEDAVAIMCKAIERRKSHCSFPLPMSTAARTAQLVPRSMYEWAARRIKLSI
jgi:short-subunit dehydrogenase